ncbi:flagellar hook-basal body complex protein FliE [Tumebacillus lipolyticus]|uniref:Flagellar hook-basal body complex protein FliE n=1 Tax=Tumebacillus lipolyticus TaxID=1280370 RepID=A0ABW4ZZE4_9BACL
MIEGINNALQVTGLNPTKALQGQGVNRSEGPSFSDFLNRAIEGVNNQQKQADQLTELLASGQETDLHTVMIAAEKASVSFQLMVQVRNKAMEAYQEVMRMQV